jgi:sucrose-6-phosphate hydrolase SacC (GH32 family)
MLYRPPPHLRMWDTWMFRDGNTYHLFTLTQPYEKHFWDRVCHATTTDWIHWRACPEIPLQDTDNPQAWDAGCILTGSVFETGDGYAMTYGSQHEGQEKIGLLFSTDLYTWEKHPNNPVLLPQGPYYEANLNETACGLVPWRDANVIQTDDGYEALVCAGDMNTPKTANGCIARVTSHDLVNWKYHSAIASPGKYIDMEVPQYFEWNGFHYLLFSSSGVFKRINLPSRQNATGTFYLMSDEKYGSYHEPDDNILIGSGEGRVDCYVGKIIETEEGPLFHHHVCGYRTSFAAPKVVRQHTDGRLYLERWPGLDSLLGKQHLTCESPGSILKAMNKCPIGEWNTEGTILTGQAGIAMTGWMFEENIEDFQAFCTINLSQAARAGIFFRINENDSLSEKGWAISLDRERSRIELCRPILQSRTSLRIDPLDIVYGPLPDRCTVEVFVRDSYLEIYVNNRPCFVVNTSMVTASDHVSTGRMGLFADNGDAHFSNFRVRDISIKID